MTRQTYDFILKSVSVLWEMTSTDSWQVILCEKWHQKMSH